MKIYTPKTFKSVSRGSLLLLIFFMAGCQKIQDEFDHVINDHIVQLPGNYSQVNLVANTSGYGAARIDMQLINGWGIAFSPNGIAWVSSQGGGVSTIYDAAGNQARKAVVVPSPGARFGGNPTGQVFNASNTDFILSNGQAARFIFVGVDGIISGWNAPAGDTAVLIKNNSATAAYTGVAIANDGGAMYLYAANFRTRTIDVFDRTFNAVSDKRFVDPYLPGGYAPFNIRSIGDRLYVMYAKVGPDGRSEHGAGLGYVNIFNTSGVLLKRFASRGSLNAPWGVAHAPAGFFTNASQEGILIGNFGDGRINAYDLDGNFLGQLRSNNRILEIEGLWEITFPPATATTINQRRLYFAAGPDEETHGLFGYIIRQ